MLQPHCPGGEEPQVEIPIGPDNTPWALVPKIAEALKPIHKYPPPLAAYPVPPLRKQ